MIEYEKGDVSWALWAATLSRSNREFLLLKVVKLKRNSLVLLWEIYLSGQTENPTYSAYSLSICISLLFTSFYSGCLQHNPNNKILVFLDAKYKDTQINLQPKKHWYFQVKIKVTETRLRTKCFSFKKKIDINSFDMPFTLQLYYLEEGE